MAFSNTPQYSTYQQKQIPFYYEPQLRDGLTIKDQRFYNCFPESYKTPNTDQKSYYLRKRFGLRSVKLTGTGLAEIRNAFSFDGVLYFVAGNTLYKYDGVTQTTIFSGLAGTTGHVGLKAYNYPFDETNYILVADGVNLYNYNLNTLIFSVNPPGFPTPHSTYFDVMDGYILMVKAGTADIYNSQLTDWSQPWDFITAEMYPDRLLGLQRYNNYIMAVGLDSTEMFYDAAIEDGSPFQRNDSAIATIGCLSMGSCVQTDRRYIWLGDTNEGDLSVWAMEDFKPVEIASPAVKESISANSASLGAVPAYTCRVQGHQFYVLCLDTITWIYDLNEKVWHQWVYGTELVWPCRFGGEIAGGQFLGVTLGEIFHYDPNHYHDSASLPLTVEWQTEPVTFDTMNRKFLNRLTIVGDHGSSPLLLNVKWSDDNYETFSSGRVIDMSKPRPALVNMGYFRRRAFKFTTTSDVPMRLEGMELNYNVGVN